MIGNYAELEAIVEQFQSIVLNPAASPANCGLFVAITLRDLNLESKATC
jgi:hypothetical protein